MPRRREGGDASVEFILLAVTLLIPLAYFIMTLAQVEAASFATEAASREAARLLAADPSDEWLAHRQLDAIWQDYGLESEPELKASCEPVSCHNGAIVTVEVSGRVDLPLLPTWIVEGLGAGVPVLSTTSLPVEGVMVGDG